MRMVCQYIICIYISGLGVFLVAVLAKRAVFFALYDKYMRKIVPVRTGV